MAITILSSSIPLFAQIKNAQSTTVKINGNCGMCKSTIKKTGSIKKIAQVEWDNATQMATLTYDSKITNEDEILKRISLAGYDNEKFLAPDDVYNNLHGCCQYERELSAAKSTQSSPQQDHSAHSDHGSHTTELQNGGELSAVFSTYFEIKDAFVKSDGKAVAAKANEMITAIGAINMSNLKSEEHNVWMNVMNELSSDIKAIAATQDVDRQRIHFSSLSKKFYDLVKASNLEEPVYYNNCPMVNKGKGANWLSKEKAIKNPYYGSQMLTCGKTVETIQ